MLRTKLMAALMILGLVAAVSLNVGCQREAQAPQEPEVNVSVNEVTPTPDEVEVQEEVIIEEEVPANEAAPANEEAPVNEATPAE
jgi:cytoskeletal protein RodZ